MKKPAAPGKAQAGFFEEADAPNCTGKPPNFKGTSNPRELRLIQPRLISTPGWLTWARPLLTQQPCMRQMSARRSGLILATRRPSLPGGRARSARRPSKPAPNRPSRRRWQRRPARPASHTAQ